MKLRKTIHGMLEMSAPAWTVLKRTLQLSCVFLLGTLICLLSFAQTGAYDQIRYAYIFRDLSQLSLLAAALVPVCLEDLLRQGR